MNTGHNTDNLREQASDKGADAVIHHMLKAMELRIAELNNEVNVSQSLLELGIDTDLTQAIKRIYDDPLAHLVKMKDDLNTTLKSVIQKIFSKFFNKLRDKIEAVFTTEASTSNELRFYVVLKEDNSENRNEIFEILRDYKSNRLSESMPVSFQFVPRSIVPKIAVKEQIL